MIFFHQNPFDHSTAHARRLTVDNKYGFSSAASAAEDAANIYGTRPGNQSLYGQAPELPVLPPRIDRASKPPSTLLPPSTPGSSLPSRNSSSLNGGGTLGRSAQERLFGNVPKSLVTDEQQDELYSATKKLLNTVENKKLTGNGNGNSLERHDLMLNSHHNQPQQNSLDRSNVGQKNGSSYDSVSSYDSYNINNQPQQAITTSTTSLQNRLVNAPDDLKSVPSATARTSLMQQSQEYGNHTAQRNSMHEREYSFNGSSGMIDPLAAPRTSVNLPQRPTNLLIESPRKPHVIETKTDYGKYR